MSTTPHNFRFAPKPPQYVHYPHIKRRAAVRFAARNLYESTSALHSWNVVESTCDFMWTLRNRIHTYCVLCHATSSESCQNYQNNTIAKTRTAVVVAGAVILDENIFIEDVVQIRCKSAEQICQASMESCGLRTQCLAYIESSSACKY